MQRTAENTKYFHLIRSGVLKTKSSGALSEPRTEAAGIKSAGFHFADSLNGQAFLPSRAEYICSRLTKSAAGLCAALLLTLLNGPTLLSSSPSLSRHSSPHSVQLSPGSKQAKTAERATPPRNGSRTQRAPLRWLSLRVQN